MIKYPALTHEFCYKTSEDKFYYSYTKVKLFVANCETTCTKYLQILYTFVQCYSTVVQCSANCTLISWNKEVVDVWLLKYHINPKMFYKM